MDDTEDDTVPKVVDDGKVVKDSMFGPVHS